MSEKLARRFHEIYERLAPLYGYKTREDTREFDSQSNNGRLMIAVASEIEREFEYENERLKDLVQWLEIIESDLREYLEVRAAKHKWQTGQPEREGEYWIVAQDLYGKMFYATDTWVIDKNYSMWRWRGRHDDETGEPLSNVIAWQEIEPYVLGIGEGE